MASRGWHSVILCSRHAFIQTFTHGVHLPQDHTPMGYTIYWEWRGCSLPLWHVVCVGDEALLQAAAARGIACVATERRDAVIEFQGPAA